MEGKDEEKTAKDAVNDAIVLQDVTKVFKKGLKAVDNISLSIPRGQIFGLLGPNGAGKTTTISMICTLLRPTSGRIIIDGLDLEKNSLAARRKIGLVFQETTLDKELSGFENLDIHARLYKIEDRKQKVQEVLRLVGLENDQDKLVKEYSGGMKRRLEIARSVLHDPRFILLDEPTLGLDPAARRAVWQHIHDLIEKRKVTVLLTTHYLEEAERLCSRIAIIDHGRIVVEGTTEELKRSVGNDVVRITLKHEDPGLVARLKKSAAVKRVHVNGNDIVLNMKDLDRNIIALLQEFKQDEVTRLEIKRPTLDDVFFEYTGRQYQENQTEGGAPETSAETVKNKKSKKERSRDAVHPPAPAGKDVDRGLRHLGLRKNTKASLLEAKQEVHTDSKRKRGAS